MNKPNDLQTITQDDLHQYLKDTPLDQCMSLLSVHGQLRVRRETYEEAQESVKAFTEAGFVHVIGMNERPGVSHFFTLVEHREFPPGTPRNDEFIQRIFKWPDAGMMWSVATWPERPEVMSNVIDYLEESGLKMTKNIPLAAVHGCVFPIRGDNVWSLEFSSSAHPGYDPSNLEALRLKEQAAIDQEQERTRQKLANDL